MSDPIAQTIYSPVEGKTKLITEQSKVVYSSVRETDARTALARGLAEYLAQLSIQAVGGREFKFNDVFPDWAEPEEEANYPQACVYTDLEGTYEDSSFTPNMSSKNRVPQPDGRYVVSPNGYAIDFNLEIRAVDPQERMWLSAMVEDALDPVDFRSGALLELPHYFNQRATYRKRRSGYTDDSTRAQARIRIARFIVTANIAETRLEFRPDLQIRRVVEVKNV